MLQSIHPLSPNSLSTLSYPFLTPSHPSSLTFLYKPTSIHSLSSHLRTNFDPWPSLAEAPLMPAVPTAPTPPEDGPIELSPDSPSIFTTDDDPTPLQVATSVLLTGSIAVFLFRALRRRATRAKELRMRSSGAKKTMKEEALDSLKAMGTVAIEPKGPPSPVQALLR